MRKKLLGLILALIMIFSNVSVTFADTTEKLTIPVHAAYSSGNVYYAFGCDSGGNMYRYNISTKKKTCLIRGRKCKNIFAKGNYIYFSCNLYGGSDAQNHYIYRMNRNGKGIKRLASGHSPVVIGNYIYYLGISKIRYYGNVVDKNIVGIYRMKLNGTGKKCLYKSSRITQLASGNNKVYFKLGSAGNIWKYMNVRNKKVYDGKISGHKMNSSFSYGYSWPQKTYCNVTDGTYTYTFSGGNVYRKRGRSTKKLLSVGGKVQKVITVGKYVIAVTHKNNRAYAYIVQNNGKNRALLQSWFLAGGGWDY